MVHVLRTISKGEHMRTATQFPEIGDSELQQMLRRIRPVAHDPIDQIRLLDLRDVDPRKTNIAGFQRFGETVSNLSFLLTVEIGLPLLFTSAVQATLAEVFSQLHLLYRRNRVGNGNYSQIRAFELCCEEARIEHKQNRIVVPVIL